VENIDIDHFNQLQSDFDNLVMDFVIVNEIPVKVLKLLLKGLFNQTTEDDVCKLLKLSHH